MMTAPGTSALATIRIAGPEVEKFLAHRFSRRAVPGRPIHGELRDDAGVIDDPVVVLREDGCCVDLTCHGGAWITRCVADLAAADGFAISPVDVETIGSTDAETIFEHELLVSLPRARTELAAKALLAQRAAWESLIALRLSAAQIASVLQDRSLEHLLSPPTLAIVGLPNAGKSTLANQLFGRQRSIVSSVPGTTRDWVGEEADLDGLVVKLIDTPGRRETEDAIERAAIEASDATIAAADAVLLLLDASRDDAQQRSLASRFADAIVVLNKSDERSAAWSEARIAEARAALICAKSGEGLGRVIDRVKARFGIEAGLIQARAWTPRQRALLKEGRLAEITNAV